MKENKVGQNILMKFGEKENLEKFQKGQLYMKRLKYYVDLEKNTSDEDVGDLYDGQFVLNDVKFTVYDQKTGEYITSFKSSRSAFNLGFLNCPVFCMFSLDDRNVTSQRIENQRLIVRYDFTDEQRTKMKNFGNSVIIISNTKEFFSRIEKALDSYEKEYIRDVVKYYGYNKIEALEDIRRNNLRIMFWKRERYEYQQEFRLALLEEVEDFECIDIGDISDISQIAESEKILNSYLEIEFIYENDKI